MNVVRSLLVGLAAVASTAAG
ncbi:MAG: hypothetical protein RLZZ621_2516, partial [Gemmatimonadota bacterium]